MYNENKEFLNNDLAVSWEKGKVFENWVQTFAVFVSENKEEPYSFYKNVLSHLKKNLCGNVKPIFSLEGGSLIDNTDKIFELYCDKIKFINLTWNGENKIAGGVKTDKGLTDFGKSVIKQMNRFKMAVDLSHLNDKSFFDVIDKADIVLASHSNCRTICNHKRNLTDEQIKLIAEKNGIIGLNFYPLFLGDDFYRNIYENIYHLCDMGYENNIALGSDFDGAVMPNEIKDISKIPLLYDQLLKKGLKTDLLDKIFYKNAKEFMLNL